MVKVWILAAIATANTYLIVGQLTLSATLMILLTGAFFADYKNIRYISEFVYSFYGNDRI
ncbi:hypothetical protein RWE15_22375 [Virgibacillus halophilus]|uniref:Uncharacterized protein n=1 Tax=Tigheibacillus halophilus TaxID=361280 RepID=A0ABU5CCH2_9BACI|nr:hypothetical protein [Virgibacillus halophilus]